MEDGADVAGIALRTTTHALARHLVRSPFTPRSHAAEHSRRAHPLVHSPAGRMAPVTLTLKSYLGVMSSEESSPQCGCNRLVSGTKTHCQEFTITMGPIEARGVARPDTKHSPDAGGKTARPDTKNSQEEREKTARPVAKHSRAARRNTARSDGKHSRAAKGKTARPDARRAR